MTMRMPEDDKPVRASNALPHQFGHSCSAPLLLSLIVSAFMFLHATLLIGAESVARFIVSPVHSLSFSVLLVLM